MEIHPSEAELASYLDDGLAEPDARRVAGHLAVCPGCTATFRALEQADRDAGPARPPAILIQKLLAQLNARPLAEGEFPRIDGYEIVRELGRGGMGVVYLARHRRFGVVALKTIRSGAQAGAEEVARFRAEAEHAKAASDQFAGERPAVAEVYEIAESDGFLYISMEYAGGGAAHKWLADLRKQPKQVARLMIPVALALDAMHRDGVFHRDVKPANILLPFRANAVIPASGDPPLEDLDSWIADFGLAKRINDAVRPGPTKIGDLRGTPAYLAPEQVEDGRTANARTDIYSFGVTLYEMITEEPPFRARNEKQLLNRISIGFPPRPSSPSKDARDLETICQKCLEKDPRRRYQTAGELAEDLERYWNNDPIRARSPSRPRRAIRAGWRNPEIVLPIAFLVLLVGFLGASLTVALRESALQAEMRARAEDQARAQAGFARVAARAEQAVRKAAHADIVAAARTAARRGDWPAALVAYRRAIDEDMPDRLGLRAERLFGFFAVNNEQMLVSELAALGCRADLGRLAAHVALVRGAYLLCNSGRQEEGRSEIRRALASRADLLTEADAGLAEALLEARPGPMAEAPRRVVALDPLHYTAQACLVVALLGSGQPEAALLQGDRMAELFPGSPVPPFIRATVALLRGDEPGIRAGLDATAARVGDDLAGLRDFYRITSRALDILAKAEDGPAMLGPLTWFRLALLVSQMASKAVAAAKPLGFAIPSISGMFHWYGELAWGLRAARRDPKAGPDILARLAKASPEALIQSMIVAQRLVAACGQLNADRLAESRAELVQVAELAYRAADAPSLLLRSPIRYQARFLGLIADISLLKLNPGAERDRVRRVRDNLHRLVADGRQWPESRRQCVGFLVDMLAATPGPGLAADWKLDNQEGAEASLQRNRWLEQIGRTLLADLRDDTGDDRAAPGPAGKLDRWAASLAKPR